MKDVITNTNIVVSKDGDSGPYIIAPTSQIEAIQSLLEQNRIAHWIDDDAISIDGKPEIGVFNLGQSSDPRQVQAILDAAL
jgi:hypothetical protein